MLIFDDLVAHHQGANMKAVLRWHGRLQRHMVSTFWMSADRHISVTSMRPRPWWSRLGLVFYAMQRLTLEGF